MLKRSSFAPRLLMILTLISAVFTGGCAHLVPRSELERRVRREPGTDVVFQVAVARTTVLDEVYRYRNGSAFLVSRESTHEPMRDGLMQGVPYAVRVGYREEPTSRYRWSWLEEIADARLAPSDALRKSDSASVYFLTPEAAEDRGDLVLDVAMPQWWPSEMATTLRVSVAAWEQYRDRSRAIIFDANHAARLVVPDGFPGMPGADAEIFLRQNDEPTAESGTTLYEVSIRNRGRDWLGEPFTEEYRLILPEYAHLGLVARGFPGRDAPKRDDPAPRATNESLPEITRGPGESGGPGGAGGTVTVHYTGAVGLRIARSLVPLRLADVSGGAGGAGGRGGIIWRRQERNSDGEIAFFYTNEGRAPDGKDGERGEAGDVLYVETTADGER